jgi:hypothetical protein
MSDIRTTMLAAAINEARRVDPENAITFDALKVARLPEDFFPEDTPDENQAELDAALLSRAPGAHGDGIM